MGRKKAGTTRFTEANTTDAVSDLARIQAGPSLRRQIVAPSTKEGRARALQSWNDYIRLNFAQKGQNHGDDIWAWLAGDDVGNRAYAVSVCQLFLDYFIKNSTREVLVWGPEETQSQQGLTCVTAVNTIWKTLIAAAQVNVLDELASTTGKALQISRQQGPLGAADDGVVAQITRWIGTYLKDKYNLTTDSEYEKVAATCKDMELLLRILWERADDIPMSRERRVTTHIYLLILYVSGCRPGMLEDIRWKDCQLYLIRDSVDSSRSRLVLDLKLRFNKLKRDSVLLPSDRKSFTCTMTLMPTLLLDVTHLLAAWAIHTGALAYNFTSVVEILQAPHKGSDKMLLPWKKEFEDRRPWEMSCLTFRRHFKRLCLVAGLRSPPRPYFLRVGAGANLEDAGLPEAAVCQILNHTAKVHNKSYQSFRTRIDIQSAAFGDLAGDTQQFYQHLGHVWKDFDPDAPIYMTCTQVQELESRNGTRSRMQNIAELRRQGASQKVISVQLRELASYKKRLEELAILYRREKYFTLKTNQLGPYTLESEHPEEEVIWPRRHIQLDIDRLMQAWATGTIFDTDAQHRIVAADIWLRHYLAAADSAIRLTPDAAGEQTAPTTSAASVNASAEESEGRREIWGKPEVEIPSASLLSVPSGKDWKCIVCSKLFVRRAELTKHFARAHKATLQQPFPCPACQVVTSTPSEFSNHVERMHGKQYAPYFPTVAAGNPVAAKVPTAPQVWCAICNSNVRVRTDSFLSRHFNRYHSTDTDLLDRRLDCLDCTDAHGLDIDSWVAHLAAKHNMAQAERCPFCNCFFQSQGMAPHIVRSHFNSSSRLLSCSTCKERDEIDVPLPDYASWRVHALSAGHVANNAYRTASVSGGPKKRKRAVQGPMDSLARLDTVYKKPRRGSKGASSPSDRVLTRTMMNTWLLAQGDAIEPTGSSPTDAVAPSDSPNPPLWNLAQCTDDLSSSPSQQSPGSSVVTDLDLIDPALWQDWGGSSCTSPLSQDDIIGPTEDQLAWQLGCSTGRRLSPISKGSTNPDIVSDSLILDCIVVAV